MYEHITHTERSAWASGPARFRDLQDGECDRCGTVVPDALTEHPVTLEYLCGRCMVALGQQKCAACGDYEDALSMALIGERRFCAVCAADRECTDCHAMRPEPWPLAGRDKVPLCAKCEAKERTAA